MAASKVLLIGWDAADWKVIHPLIAAGRMPNLQRLVHCGATGQIATLHPPLSPMLWTSIATGKRPIKHGIHGFSEPTPDGRDVQPITNLSRKSKALWNILHQNHLRSIVVGWWPSHPAEPIDGVMVSDQYSHAGEHLTEFASIDEWPLAANTVHPPQLGDTLAGLRIHPGLLAPQTLAPFIPLAEQIDRNRDQRLALLQRTLAECMTVESAATWLLDRQPWDFFAVYLDSIDHFCHGFMRYHPPRQSWIDQRDYDLYHNVVSEAYQFHDRMLGILLQKAGPAATVILLSDHGFHPDHLRPANIPDIPAGPAVEHRDSGILAISGPNIKRGAALYGASLLDVAPTILALYGLPVGEDMDGKVLVQAFESAPSLSFIPSWEEVPGADGRHPPHTQLDPVAARQSLEQMIALGYIEKLDENREAAVTKTIRELRYNLGESLQYDARHHEAHRIFHELHTADPDEQRFAVRLFASCQALELHDEMRRIVDDLDSRRRALFEEAGKSIEVLLKTGIERVYLNKEAGAGRNKEAGAGPETMLDDDEQRELARCRNLARYQPAVVDYLRAQVLIADKRYNEALAALQRVRPVPRLDIADLYVRLGRSTDARKVYQEAIEIDPDNARAHLGLCCVALRRRAFSNAAQSALDALERTYSDPRAHFLLGLALAEMKQYEGAAEAFRAAISFNPNFPLAHVRLARLLEKHLGDPESAREHRLLVCHIQARGMKQRPPKEEERGAYRFTSSATQSPIDNSPMPPLSECLVVVTGLPRSGTSMLMQMLAAGGLEVLTDGLRQADEDNPLGFFEYEPAKNLLESSQWLREERGKAIKLVVPLLAALPPGLACRVILIERDLDEVLDSQRRMLERSNHPLPITPLKDEYARALDRARSMLLSRPKTRLLVIQHRQAIFDPRRCAEDLSNFLGLELPTAKMAAVIDPSLHRHRRNL